jgi:xylan 1,4-beta-xylosidase
MFAIMPGERVDVSGSLAYDYKSILEGSVRGEKTDINALASRDHKSVAVMVWNYHDDDIQDAGSHVIVNIKNLNVKKAKLFHYRIDATHSNSYEVWKKMGSPQNPTEQQIKELEKSGKLQMLSKPVKVKISDNELKVEMQLARQAVSLIKLTY